MAQTGDSILPTRRLTELRLLPGYPDKICKTCEALDFASWLDAIALGNADVLLHHRTFADLLQSAALDCKLCSFFTAAMLDTRCDEQGVEIEEALAMEDACDKEPESGFLLSPIKQAFDLRDSPISEGCRGFHYERMSYDSYETWSTLAPQTLSIDFVLLPRTYTHAALVSRHIALFPDYDQCKAWITHCGSKHRHCNKLGDRALPTRLLDLASHTALAHDDLKLVLTGEGQLGQYLALSHCWGTSKPPVTDAEAYSRYLDGIAYHSLLKTFRHAIAVTRRLGYRYLWIDCFCIIQGDTEDFQRECAKMHETFENAEAVICAPAAADANAGLLQMRNRWDGDEAVELMCGGEAESRRGTIAVRRLREPEYIREVKDWEAALATRAWIMQERQLSSRVLCFGTKLTYFECNSGNCYETICYPTFSNGDPEAWQDIGARHILKNSISHDGAVDALENWSRLIVAYTSCNLTMESDKLPALSGLASRLHDRTGDEYVAGMCRSRLLDQLAWIRSTGSTDRRSRFAAEKPGPSFSWVSCDYAVTFRQEIVMSKKNLVSKSTFGIYHCQPVGLDPYGQIQSSFLEITGHVQPVLVRDHPDNIDRKLCPFVLAQTGSDAKLFASFYCDSAHHKLSDLNRHSEPPFLCLLLGVRHPGRSSDGADTWFGLVIQRAKTGVNEFRRVGFTDTFHPRRDSWISHAESLRWIMSGESKMLRLI